VTVSFHRLALCRTGPARHPSNCGRTGPARHPANCASHDSSHMGSYLAACATLRTPDTCNGPPKLLPVVEHLTRQYRIVPVTAALTAPPASSVGTSSSDKDRCRRPHSGRRKTHRRPGQTSSARTHARGSWRQVRRWRQYSLARDLPSAEPSEPLRHLVMRLGRSWGGWSGRARTRSFAHRSTLRQAQAQPQAQGAATAKAQPQGSGRSYVLRAGDPVELVIIPAHHQDC
jgi:hypothetical protein